MLDLYHRRTTWVFFTIFAVSCHNFNSIFFCLLLIIAVVCSKRKRVMETSVKGARGLFKFHYVCPVFALKPYTCYFDWIWCLLETRFTTRVVRKQCHSTSSGAVFTSKTTVKKFLLWIRVVYRPIFSVPSLPISSIWFPDPVQLSLLTFHCCLAYPLFFQPGCKVIFFNRCFLW